MTVTRIGIMTSGGDAPGMNAVIVGALHEARDVGVELCPISGGYRGLAEGRTTRVTPAQAMRHYHQAGTLIGTSRWPELRTPEGLATVTDAVDACALDGIIVVGGAGSLAGAAALYRAGVPVVGVPATIDNDIPGIRATLGMDSAVNYALRIIDDLRATATSLRHRAFLVETLGGDSGNLARAVADAAVVGLVITPDDPTALRTVIAQLPGEVDADYGIVVMGEGAGPAHRVAQDISSGTGLRVRVTVLGHSQRAAWPTAIDRRGGLASGRAAVAAAVTKRSVIVDELSPHVGDPIPLAALGR